MRGTVHPPSLGMLNPRTFPSQDVWGTAAAPRCASVWRAPKCASCIPIYQPIRPTSLRCFQIWTLPGRTRWPGPSSHRTRANHNGLTSPPNHLRILYIITTQKQLKQKPPNAKTRRTKKTRKHGRAKLGGGKKTGCTLASCAKSLVFPRGE